MRLITVVLIAVILAPKIVASQTEFPRVPPHLREMAEYWAPVVFQDMCQTCDNGLGGEGDYFTRVNFDGDYEARNNWDNAADPKYIKLPYVYYYATEIEEHVFLQYYFFYPRDFRTSFTKSEPGYFDHENDLEGLILLVEKTGANGTLLAMATEAHGSIYYFKTQALASNCIVDIENREDEWSLFMTDNPDWTSHPRPVAFVEAGGHGYGGYHRAMNDLDRLNNPYSFVGVNGTFDFEGGDGIVYYYDQDGSTYPEPSTADRRTAGYELLTLNDLWSRRYTRGPETLFTMDTIRFESSSGVVQNNLSKTFAYTNNTPSHAHTPWKFASQGHNEGEFFFDPARMFKSDISNLFFDSDLNYIFNPQLLGNSSFWVESPGSLRVVPWNSTSEISWGFKRADQTLPTVGSDDTSPVIMAIDVWSSGTGQWRSIDASINISEDHTIWRPSDYFEENELPAATKIRFRLFDPGSSKVIHTVESGPFQVRQIAGGDLMAMDFEDGVDGNVISSSIPGMYFTTTDGYDWIYGDKTTGNYHVFPYLSGSYVCNGDFFAWLGTTQGAGRITFVGNTAKSVSMKTSTYSGLYLEAYDSQGRLLDSDYAAPNTNSGNMATLSISGENIAHILVHDSGNQWLIDDLVVEDLLRSSVAYLDDDYGTGFETLDLIDQGQAFNFPFEVGSGVDLELILNWGGSELSLEATDPSGEVMGSWRSEYPPIIVRLDDPNAGLWNFRVEAHDVPSPDYPFAFVIGATEPPLDETAPLITIASPEQGGQYSDYLPVLFDFQVEDPESGIVSLEAFLDGSIAVSSGDLLLVDAATSHEFTVTATNGAGLVSTESVEFSVLDFEWGDPLGLPGPEVAFVSQAYRTIPVKFSLRDGEGIFIMSEDVRIVLEGTEAAFSICDGTTSSDGCIRMDLEEYEEKYIVNFHTNPQRHDYGLMGGDVYLLKAFVDEQMVGTREIMFPSFDVVDAGTNSAFGPGESLAVQWSLPDGVTASGSDILLSVDGGMTWEEVGHVGGDTYTFDIVCPNVEFTTARVMTVTKSSSGIIHGLSGEFTASNISDSPLAVPGKVFALEQNVPNPFNPSTAIKFSVASSCNVHLEVYDISGKRIAELLNGKQLEAGLHEVFWDGTDHGGRDVPAGVYFYRLVAGDYQDTKRMTLVK